jgi:hypothetical protein
VGPKRTVLHHHFQSILLYLDRMVNRLLSLYRLYLARMLKLDLPTLRLHPDYRNVRRKLLRGIGMRDRRRLFDIKRCLMLSADLVDVGMRPRVRQVVSSSCHTGSMD